MIFLLKIFIYMCVVVFFWAFAGFASDPYGHVDLLNKREAYEHFWHPFTWIVHFVVTIIVLAIGYFIFFII
jgi:hypothetical protein